MEISVIGISHHTAPVEVREQFALPEDLARRFLRTAHSEDVFQEALVLDTCNRTEVFFVSSGDRDSLEYLVEHIARLKGISSMPDPSVFYRHDGPDAVAHLFRVAASLDSQIVGEDQILGQMKNAYHLAVEERTSRFLLDKLLHWAFRVGKKVRTETQIARGSVSIAQAAVELARQIFTSLEGKTVMFVGAGETAQLAAKAIIRWGAGRVIVANRTLSRADEVARELLRQLDEKPENALPSAACRPGNEQGQQVICPALLRLDPDFKLSLSDASKPQARKLTAEAITLADIPSVIGEVDLLICSTGAPQAVVTYESAGNILRRIDHPLFIIDIAVPRDVDERLGELSNVFLHNIDDLNHLVARNLDRRRKEIPRAQAIIDDEVRQFGRWRDSLQVTPTIKLLQEHFAALQQAEIKRYGRLFATDGEQLERFTQSLCKKILHRPVAFLRELSATATTSERMAAADMIRRMFDLKSKEQEE